MTQQLKPTSVINPDGWVDQADGTTNIHQAIDETDVNTADYLQTSPTGGGGGGGGGVETEGMPLVDSPLGLYGGGSNVPTGAHHTAGVAAEAQVPEAGAVVVSLGHSICREIWLDWAANQAPGDTTANLILPESACGGCVASIWMQQNGEGWINSRSVLVANGKTGANVHAVFMKVTDSQVDPATVAQMEAILVRIKVEYPNVKQIFCTSRVYGGYRVNGSTEFAGGWQSGRNVREFILNHLGQTDPWIAWTDYLWANGATPRGDGLTWVVSDFQADGLHLSQQGEAKAAARIHNWFMTSAYTKWYRGQ